MSIYFGADNTVIHSASGLGGMVQVLQTVKTDTFSQVVTAGSLSNVCISRTFTASSTSNKLLLMASLYCNSSDQWTQNGIVFTDNGNTISGARGDTFNSQGRVSGAWSQAVTNEALYHAYATYLHTPSDTNSHTYGIKLYQGSGYNNQTLTLNFSNNQNITTRVRTMSTFTILEVSV